MEPAGERIRIAALELFAERGFHGTGIRDLAERAGLSSGRQIALDRPPPERIAGLVHIHVLTHATWPLETRVVDGEMRALSAARRDEIVALRDEYEGLWQQAIETGHRQGYFGVQTPRLARLALLEMCSGVARWYQPQGPIALDDLAVRYAEMALGLLGAEPVRLPSANESVRRSIELIDTIWPASG
jgi:hypothetical protein